MSVKTIRCSFEWWDFESFKDWGGAIRDWVGVAYMLKKLFGSSSKPEPEPAPVVARGQSLNSQALNTHPLN